MTAPITLIPPHYDTPGPGTYDVSYSQISRTSPAYTFSGSFRRRQQTSQICPLTYTPNDKFMSASAPSFTIKCTSYQKFRRISPGPGTYTPNDNFLQLSTKAATLHSRVMQKTSQTPAPNAYFISNKLVEPAIKSAVFAVPRREPLQRSASANLSALSYSGNYKFLKQQSPKYTIRSRTPIQVNEKGLLGSGPGMYNTRTVQPKDKGCTMSGWCKQGFNIW